MLRLHILSYKRPRLLCIEVRIIMPSAIAWAVAIIVSSENLFTPGIVKVYPMLLLISPFYFNVSVYMEVRRNKKQIAANQVSLKTKEKLLKKREAFYTTVIVLLVILLCYIPKNICVVIVINSKERIPHNRGVTAMYVLLYFQLNSLFNPLIYAVRIHYFAQRLVIVTIVVVKEDYFTS